MHYTLIFLGSQVFVFRRKLCAHKKINKAIDKEANVTGVQYFLRGIWYFVRINRSGVSTCFIFYHLSSSSHIFSGSLFLLVTPGDDTDVIAAIRNHVLFPPGGTP